MADSKNKGARSIIFAPYFFAFPSLPRSFFICTQDKVLEKIRSNSTGKEREKTAHHEEHEGHEVKVKE